MSLEFKHIPVMSEDIDRILTPYKSGLYIDCTFGGGSITRKILSKKKRHQDAQRPLAYPACVNNDRNAAVDWRPTKKNVASDIGSRLAQVGWNKTRNVARCVVI